MRLRKPKTGEPTPPSTVTKSFSEVAPGPDAPSSFTKSGNRKVWIRRGILAAAVIAALVAGTAIAASQLRSSDESSTAAAVTTTGAKAGPAFGTAKEGNCLTWQKPDASDLAKVDCKEQHLFEVTAEVDLSKYPTAEFGPDSPFPGTLRFAELRDTHCVPAAKSYLHGKLDPFGKFSAGLINPGPQGWAAGERTLRCGLQITATTGRLQPMKGSVADQDQSRVWDPGTCVGIMQGQPTDPIDCNKEHAFEIISVVDLGAEFKQGSPSVENQDKFLNKVCTDAANAYLGSPDALKNKTLTLFWDNPDPISWLAGSKKVNCSVGKQDTGGFAPLVNSAKTDGLLINGQKPVPLAGAPEGRSMPTPLPGAEPAPVPGGN
ncbi:septum formation family protein [Smaragdicoccus niigatensis]|uniref:septum formation family protein n=1 Tax=Smaragdicoccus niigatensis TaxID=359359 RepID=UPI0003818752|nr:septum formation family protein [Smaragdicoccus niigatensis]